MKKSILTITALTLFALGATTITSCGDKKQKEGSETHEHSDGEESDKDHDHKEGEESHEGHNH